MMPTLCSTPPIKETTMNMQRFRGRSKSTDEPIHVHDIDIGPGLFGGYCVFVRGVRVGAAFDSLEAVWTALFAKAKRPKPKQDHPRAPPHLTAGLNAGYVVFDNRGSAIGDVLGAADRAGGRFAAWAKSGKIGEFPSRDEAEAAVHTRAAADARAVREKRKAAKGKVK